MRKGGRGADGRAGRRGRAAPRGAHLLARVRVLPLRPHRRLEEVLQAPRVPLLGLVDPQGEVEPVHALLHLLRQAHHEPPPDGVHGPLQVPPRGGLVRAEAREALHQVVVVGVPLLGVLQDIDVLPLRPILRFPGAETRGGGAV